MAVAFAATPDSAYAVSEPVEQTMVQTSLTNKFGRTPHQAHDSAQHHQVSARSYDNLQSLFREFNVDPSFLQEHVEYIRSFIQKKGDDAFRANYKKEEAKIFAALKVLTGQTWSILDMGHKADVKALKLARAKGNRVISKARVRAKHNTKSYKEKACFTKQARDVLVKKKRAARQKMTGIGRAKICKDVAISRCTFGDMDVDKASPSYGIPLRKLWESTRGHYVV